MKKNQKSFIAAALAWILFIGLSCEKPPAPDPDAGLSELQKLDKAVPITATGANTFGCLVDGKLFLPKDDKNPLNSSALSAEYLPEDSTLHMVAINYPSNGESVVLNIKKVVSGKLKLWSSSSQNASARYLGVDSYYTTDTDTGIVEITHFDLQQQIVAGKFLFRAAERINDTPKVVISEGRFDIRFSVN